jgi:hypothetical protein
MMNRKKTRILTLFAIVLFACAVGINSGCKGKQAEEAEEMATLEIAPDIKERLARFSPTEVTYDESLLSDEQQQVLEKLVMAAKYMDKIFWKQASHTGLDILEELKKSTAPGVPDALSYMKINFGPFDRLDENHPFVGTDPKPAGAGFYPPALTKDYFLGYVDGYPEKKEELESHFTIVKKENDSLIAVPYNEAYREYLEPAAQHLREAAEITTNPMLKAYLTQKAEDLLQNDYYESDCLWIDLEGNLVEIVIGPYEVYEDNLLGIKAAYESFVFINDFEEMKKIEGYLDYLAEMQEQLPVEQKYKDMEVAGLKSPLNVVMLVYSAGDTKAGVQTLAFVLPNDERIREEKGTKKVFLKNIMEAKFNKALIPISKQVLSPEDAEHVSFYAFFTETMLHEICHALGVNYVTLPEGEKITVNKALGKLYSHIEECKATIVGVHNGPFLIEKGLIPQDREKEIYSTYLAGMFRSIRFGAHEAHGMGSLMQLNFHRETGAFVYDEETGKFRVDMDKIKDSVKAMAQEILILEGDGDYSKVEEFISRYGNIDEVIQKTINRLTDIPVDIEPIFPFD